jgi:periplasmic copper chaperone A
MAVAVTAPAFAAGGVSIERPWMRFIIKARPAAGYFSLRNAGDKPVTLTGARSPACGMLMLHESKEENGVASMRPVASVVVPARGTLDFAPGGYHLMCMQPQPALKVGASVVVTLEFGDGQSLAAPFPVRGPGGN